MNNHSLSAMTGLPAKHKPKSRRAKKPGGQHLAQLTQAHGAGDYAKAKIHALNYAKAAHTHLAGNTATSPMGDDLEETGEAPVTNTAPPAAATPAGVSSLAALMQRSRQK